MFTAGALIVGIKYTSQVAAAQVCFFTCVKYIGGAVFVVLGTIQVLRLRGDYRYCHCAYLMGVCPPFVLAKWQISDLNNSEMELANRRLLKRCT